MMSQFKADFLFAWKCTLSTLKCYAFIALLYYTSIEKNLNIKSRFMEFNIHILKENLGKNSIFMVLELQYKIF